MVAEMFEWIMHLIWTFRLWILFGSTIPWTASVAEHGGIFCYIQLHQFPGLYQTWIDNGLSFQVSTDWSCPACCSCSNSTWRPSSGLCRTWITIASSKELDCTFFHLMNNQMNIFIKLICPRKFQQTDRVQPTAPAQIQQEDLLQVTNGGWGVWMSHALVPNIVECETFLCGNSELKTHLGLQIAVT